MMPVTHVPQTPEFVKGVINLRGKVIPVVDLRLRFALEAAAYTERTCIIVVEVRGRRLVMMGIVVDAVSEVLNIRGADIENTPAFGCGSTRISFSAWPRRPAGSRSCSTSTRCSAARTSLPSGTWPEEISGLAEESR
jgi:chemotaxis signal transduction protein